MCLLSQRRRRAKGQAGYVDYFLEVPLQDRGESLPGLIEARHLPQDVNNRFGRETGDGRTAEMLDSLDQISGKTGE